MKARLNNSLQLNSNQEIIENEIIARVGQRRGTKEKLEKEKGLKNSGIEEEEIIKKLDEEIISYSVQLGKEQTGQQWRKIHEAELKLLKDKKKLNENKLEDRRLSMGKELELIQSLAEREKKELKESELKERELKEKELKEKELTEKALRGQVLIEKIKKLESELEKTGSDIIEKYLGLELLGALWKNRLQHLTDKITKPMKLALVKEVNKLPVVPTSSPKVDEEAEKATVSLSSSIPEAIPHSPETELIQVKPVSKDLENSEKALKDIQYKHILCFIHTGAVIIKGIESKNAELRAELATKEEEFKAGDFFALYDIQNLSEEISRLKYDSQMLEIFEQCKKWSKKLPRYLKSLGVKFDANAFNNPKVYDYDRLEKIMSEVNSLLNGARQMENETVGNKDFLDYMNQSIEVLRKNEKILNSNCTKELENKHKANMKNLKNRINQYLKETGALQLIKTYKDIILQVKEQTFAKHPLFEESYKNYCKIMELVKLFK